MAKSPIEKALENNRKRSKRLLKKKRARGWLQL